MFVMFSPLFYVKISRDLLFFFDLVSWGYYCNAYIHSVVLRYNIVYIIDILMSPKV